MDRYTNKETDKRTDRRGTKGLTEAILTYIAEHSGRPMTLLPSSLLKTTKHMAPWLAATGAADERPSAIEERLQVA